MELLEKHWNKSSIWNSWFWVPAMQKMVQKIISLLQSNKKRIIIIFLSANSKVIDFVTLKVCLQLKLITASLTTHFSIDHQKIKQIRFECSLFSFLKLFKKRILEFVRANLNSIWCPWLFRFNLSYHAARYLKPFAWT